MKRLHNGLIIFDALDIVCISFSAGYSMAWLVKLYRKKKLNKGQDPIIAELKKKSSITMCSTNGKPLKIPVFRGGDDSRIKGFSLILKNKKLSKLLMAVVNAKKKQRQLKLLSDFFLLLNTILTTSVGLRFAIGGSLTYSQIILFGLPSTLGGFMIGLVGSHPLLSVLIPIGILAGRGIENIPNPYNKCKLICEAAADYHNEQILLEMKNFNSLLKDTATALQLPIDKVPLLCVEQPLSVIERYKLESLIENDKLESLVRSAKFRNRVQHFSKFIKKFPQCNANPEVLYEETLSIVE